MTEGFRSLASVSEAIERIFSRVSHRPSSIDVAIDGALMRFLAEDIYSPVSIPPEDRAVVDGYAVRSADTFGASQYNPIRLRLRGFARVGQRPQISISRNEALEVTTGTPLPPGADAVVMYERTRRMGDTIEVMEPVPPYGNVSRRGEDVEEGELILRTGTRLMPWDIAVLASVGIKKVRVYDLKVAVISVGDELVELDGVQNAKEVLSAGRVINSNRFSISAMLKMLSAEPIYLGIVPDERNAVAEAITKGLKVADAVITLGGASVGKIDITVEAARSLGADPLIHGIALRPGRANSVAVIDGKPVFMLAGFPVASIVGFEAIAKPTLLRMMGAEEEPRAVVRGRLTRRITTPINVRSYVRVRVIERGGELLVEPLALTGSGVLSTLVKSNGILVVPENREGYDEGDEVEVILFRHINRAS